MIIDTREPKKMVAMFEAVGCDVTVATLDIGDYADIPYKRKDDGRLSYVIVAERKRMADLANRLYSGSLFKQAIELAEAPIPYYFIIGSVEKFEKDAKLKFNREAIYGAIASLSLRYGIQVMWVPSEEEFVKILRKIFMKAKEKKIGKPHSIRNLYKGRDKRIDILCTLFRVSRRQAKELLKRYSIKEVLGLNENQLEKIDFIGPATARKIVMLVGSKEYRTREK